MVDAEPLVRQEQEGDAVARGLLDVLGGRVYRHRALELLVAPERAEGHEFVARHDREVRLELRDARDGRLRLLLHDEGALARQLVGPRQEGAHARDARGDERQEEHRADAPEHPERDEGAVLVVGGARPAAMRLGEVLDGRRPEVDVGFEPATRGVGRVLALADGPDDGLELARVPVELLVEVREVGLGLGDARGDARDEGIGPERAVDARDARLEVVGLGAALRVLGQRERVHVDRLQQQVRLVPVEDEVLLVGVAPQDLLAQRRVIERRVVELQVVDGGLEPRRRPERAPHEELGALRRGPAGHVGVRLAHGRQPAAVGARRLRPHVRLAVRAHDVRDVRRAVGRRHGVAHVLGVRLDGRVGLADGRRDVGGRVELLVRGHAVELGQDARRFGEHVRAERFELRRLVTPDLGVQGDGARREALEGELGVRAVQDAHAVAQHLSDQNLREARLDAGRQPVVELDDDLQVPLQAQQALGLAQRVPLGPREAGRGRAVGHALAGFENAPDVRGAAGEAREMVIGPVGRRGGAFLGRGGRGEHQDGPHGVHRSLRP
mmetsp:Transcript_4702/g.13941  ORF Transcript_4702/g.13941 Transcript_4702/m.13941 type:complete len:554 (-) Transcript_4702:157-1818(-)